VVVVVEGGSNDCGMGGFTFKSFLIFNNDCEEDDEEDAEDEEVVDDGIDCEFMIEVVSFIDSVDDDIGIDDDDED
jgi:hypothetical protein